MTDGSKANRSGSSLEAFVEDALKRLGYAKFKVKKGVGTEVVNLAGEWLKSKKGDGLLDVLSMNELQKKINEGFFG